MRRVVARETRAEYRGQRLSSMKLHEDCIMRRRIHFAANLAVPSLALTLLACPGSNRDVPTESPQESVPIVEGSSGEAPSPSTESEDPAAEGSAELPPLADPERFAASLDSWAEAYSAWERGYRHQLVLARLFAHARQDASPRKLQLALHRLGQGLADFRSDWDPVLINELRRLTAPSQRDWVTQIDSRYAPPMAEALLDVGDWAAVTRWADMNDDGAGADALAGPASAARANGEATRLSAELPAELECESITLDGAAQQTVPAGSYEVGCQSGPRLILMTRDGVVPIPETE